MVGPSRRLGDAAQSPGVTGGHNWVEDLVLGKKSVDIVDGLPDTRTRYSKTKPQISVSPNKRTSVPPVVAFPNTRTSVPPAAASPNMRTSRPLTRASPNKQTSVPATGITPNKRAGIHSAGALLNKRTSVHSPIVPSPSKRKSLSASPNWRQSMTLNSQVPDDTLASRWPERHSPESPSYGNTEGKPTITETPNIQQRSKMTTGHATASFQKLEAEKRLSAQLITAIRQKEQRAQEEPRSKEEHVKEQHVKEQKRMYAKRMAAKHAEGTQVPMLADKRKSVQMWLEGVEHFALPEPDPQGDILRELGGGN